MTKPPIQPIDYEDELWIDLAQCRLEAIPTRWFYSDEETKQYDHDKEVMDVCSRCPVRIQCGDYAMRENEPGIWGGMYEDQRTKLKARRKSAWDAMLEDIGPEISSVARSISYA